MITANALFALNMRLSTKCTIKLPKRVIIWNCMPASELGCFEFIEDTANVVKYQQIFQNSLLVSNVKLNVGENYILQEVVAVCYTVRQTVWRP